MKTISIISHPPSKTLLIGTAIMSIIYIIWWLWPANSGNGILFVLLLIGELFHVITALLFLFTVRKPYVRPVKPMAKWKRIPSVDIYITIVNEPVEIVRQTIQHAVSQSYGHHNVYLLNDGFVAGNPDWKSYETLAVQEGVQCITRTTPGGAKAGNINHALSKTSSEYIVIVDADMKLKKEFLDVVMPYMKYPEVAFVQTPQYYANHEVNSITSSAWNQQELFFGPVMTGKDQDNAAFICGTNVVIRRKALESVGGFSTDSIAEDILTSVLIHARGWKSVYLPDILSEGLAPEDIGSYIQQQYRWTRGSLELLFNYNPLYLKGLTIQQKLHYFASTFYYLNGIIVLIDAIVPLFFFFFGIVPVTGSTTSFAFFFLPFLFLNLFVLQVVTAGNFSLQAMSFSHSLWFVQVLALINRLTNKKVEFKVTPKEKQHGNYTKFALPHIVYSIVGTFGAVVAIRRDGYSPSVFTNIAWVLFVILLFLPFIRDALGKIQLSRNLPAMRKQYESN